MKICFDAFAIFEGYEHFRCMHTQNGARTNGMECDRKKKISTILKFNTEISPRNCLKPIIYFNQITPCWKEIPREFISTLVILHPEE